MTETAKTADGETYDTQTGQVVSPKEEERKRRSQAIVLREQAKIFLRSGYSSSKVYREEQVITIVRAGAELGLPFHASLRSISIIEGKISLESSLMRALVFRNIKGARIDFIEVSSERCVVEMRRPGGRINTFVYTIEDAKRAGLLKKPNWQKHPISMLMARVSSIGCKALFADVLLGGNIYDPDEIEDMLPQDSDEQLELDRLRESIYSLASALSEERRTACLQQTEQALSQRNTNLLVKILNRLKDIVEAKSEIVDAEIVSETTSNGVTEHHGNQ
jgi:hypothetical protein